MLGRILLTLTADDALVLVPREILEVTDGLAKELQIKLYKLKIQDNSITIANYILYMKHEVNISENYKISLLRTLIKLSNFTNKLFSVITREDVKFRYHDSRNRHHDALMLRQMNQDSIVFIVITRLHYRQNMRVISHARLE